MTLDEIKEKLDESKNIVILVHDNPDGDAIGSGVAMYLALKNMGKEVDFILPSYPSCFKEVLNLESIVKSDEEVKDNYDLAIALDCASTKQMHLYNEVFEKIDNTISIDHHPSNNMYADLNYVNSDSPACAQLLYVVFNYLGIEITTDIAKALVAGIITDTGGFRYSGVTEETFAITADLVSHGFKISDIYQKVFSEKTKSKFLLHQIAMNRIEFLLDGKLAYTYITDEDFKSVDAEDGDSDGIVEMGRDVDGVEVSLYLRVKEDGEIKGSLRSNEYVNVSELAQIYGGGGHIRAAGFSLPKDFTLEKAKTNLVSTIKEYLDGKK
jgi:phosphoesterase RecJ-like protein